MEKKSDSLELQDKAQGRPVIVLARLEPTSLHFESAKKLLMEWKDSLGKTSACLGVDVICCAPEQIAWIEHWDSKASLDLFNKEQLPFSSFLSALFENSRSVPTRYIYRKLF
ncbi:MAG: hypothetical protein R3E61_04165 [Pseudomonadales bacterium]